jgi:hypothetical protein
MRKFFWVSTAILALVLILLILVSLVLYIAGCSVRTIRGTIPRECITQVQLSDHTHCEEQQDGTYLCKGLLLTFRKGCERVKIQ